MEVIETLGDNGLLHITVCFISIYNFGWIYGGILVWLIIVASDYLLSQIGYQRLQGVDLAMSIEGKYRNNNIGGYYVIEKLKFEDFKKTFIKRALTKIRKLRQIQIKRFGMKFWKDIDMDIASNQITQIYDNFKSEQDVVKYINDITDSDMPFEKPLWEIRFGEDYTKTESVMISRLHHSVTDGLGYISLFSGVNDNQFSMKLPGAGLKMNIFMNILFKILTIPIALYNIPKLTKIQTDPETKKFYETKGKENRTTKYYISEWFPWDKVKVCYQRYKKTSFNDYIIGVISVCLHEWLTKNGIKNPKEIVGLVPVNTRSLPTGYEEVNMDKGKWTEQL